MLLSYCVIGSPVKSIIGAQSVNGTPNADPKPYDSKVQYIATNTRNDSRQYIDTGIILQESNGLLHDFVISYKANKPGDWGWYAYGFANCPWVGVKSNDKCVFFGYYNHRYSWNAASGFADYCYDSMAGWFVNGVQKYESSVVLGSDTRCTMKGKNLYIFICYDLRYGMSRSIREVTQYSSFRIEVDGIVVRDYIPVRITNESGNREGALYDTISGEVFRNLGTGLFDIGPDMK